MYYFSTYRHYIEALHKNHAPTQELVERVRLHPDSKDAKKELDAVLLTQKDEDALAASTFVREIQDGFAQMRSANHRRTLEKPSADDFYMLQLLKGIDNPPDGLLKAVARTIGGQALTRLALVSIAQKACVPGHKLPPELLDFKKPIPEKEADALIDKLESFMKGIEKPDSARKAKEYEAESDLWSDVLELDEKTQPLFKDAITLFVEKY